MKFARALLVFIIVIAAYLVTSDSTQELREGVKTPDLSPSGAELVAGVARHKQALDMYGRLPLHFERNTGQAPEGADFVARGLGYSLLINSEGAVLVLNGNKNGGSKPKSAAVGMSIVGGNASPLSASEVVPARSNYFVGDDPAQWRADVPNYNKIGAADVYDGIDVVYYGNNRRLEFDFVVSPHADPGQIELQFTGVKKAHVEADSGDLLLDTGNGVIRQHKPVAYQEEDGQRREIAASYLLDGEKVRFSLGLYDHERELVIDPILSYGTYLGGSIFDEGRGIDVDQQGNVYVVGTSASLNYPTTAGTIKPTLLPRSDLPNSYWYDAVVTKIDPSGSSLVFSTYFGGRNGNESGTGVAVDAGGNVLISGTTMANDLPTVNAYQSAFGGTDDAFAAKLNPTGSAILYSTYLGGNNTDIGGRIAVNEQTGDTVFVGGAYSGNFPTTPGAYKPRLCDDTPGSCNGIFYSGSYVVKLSATGTIIYSTLFDAGISDVVLDAADNAVLGGSVGTTFPATPGAFQTVSSGGADGFIAKLNPGGTGLTYGTFLGGGLQSDRVKGVAIDQNGNIYATGQTENSGFPTTEGSFDRTFNGNHDGFVAKLNAAGSALVYSTFLGGTGRDEPFAIDLAPNGDVFVAGETLSALTFPLRNSIMGTNGNMFLTRVNSSGSGLVFSSLLGQGGAYDLVTDDGGNAYVTGQTTSIPTTPGAFQTMKGDPSSTSSNKDAFVLKLSPTDEDVVTYSISGTVTDPTQFQNYQPITVTLSGPVSRSYILPYGSGSGVIPYYFGDLPPGGNYTVSAHKIGFTTLPENVVFTNLNANQFADFTIQNNEKPQGVITSPAHGAQFNAPASITIQATASDPDGDEIAKVDFTAYSSTAGSINLGTDTTAPYEFTWHNVPAGTWSLAAIPTDSKGLRGYSTPTVHVMVVDPNPVSVAIISPVEGQVFRQGDYVPISVSVSSSVSLVEVKDQNNNLVARMTGQPWQSTWRVMETGSYTLTATASNVQNQTATSAPVTFAVNPIDHRISGRILGNIGSTPVPGVVINLTSSTNPAIAATTTTDSTGSFVFTGLGTTPNDSVKITPILAGYDFSPPDRSMAYLGYIDWPNQNFIATQQTGITVEMTTPINGQVFVAPATIAITAEASSTAGTIARVDFYRRDGGNRILLGSDTNPPYSFDWANVGTGSYFLYVQAVDNNDRVARSAEARVTVNAQAAVIRLQGDITNPAGGWMQGIPVRLTGTVNGSPVDQTSTSNSFGSYGFFNLAPGGDYTITPQGMGGMTFTPPSVTITNAQTDQLDIDFVSSAANQPPTVQINSPANGAVYVMPVAIPVNVTASDPDGQIVHLTVSADGNNMFATIGQSNNGTFSAPWQPNAPGRYRIWAQARDNGGLLTSTSIDITVEQPAPVAISGRIVDRGSNGLEGIRVDLFDYPSGEDLVATTVTGPDGRFTLPGIQTFRSYLLEPSSVDHSFAPRRRIYVNLNAEQNAADFTGTLQVELSDFDGDSEADLAVWRPSTGVWHVERSADKSYGALTFGSGALGDVVAPGNFDGDKKTDYAVFRNGLWWILNSSDGTVRVVPFGTSGDSPVAADYDGDGRMDIAVWRPSTGTWYIMRSSDSGYTYHAFGMAGDKPVAADYDGDGLADPTVWRPSTGTWWTLNSTNGAVLARAFGTAGDLPLTGDFDGDKKSDLAVYRPQNGVWYIMQSTSDTVRYAPWGMAEDTPVPGDYDRDGKCDVAVFRPSTGIWYLTYSSTGDYAARKFGLGGDIPIAAAYIR